MKLSERHARFHALHQSGCFVLPNPWDAGSARMMAALGARALATTSAGFAFTLGKADMGQTTRDENLVHAEQIVAATPLPVSGDFENGFADEPDDIAETVRLAREVGLSGCSIEDTMMVDGNPAYDFEKAVERIKAAADAVRSMAEPFVLCARADGVMNGTYDIEEAVRRVKAFESAGADCVYVPVPPGPKELARVIAAVNAPVNALATGPLLELGVNGLAELGVRRISLGSMISRLTHATILESVSAMLGKGDFSVLKGAAKGSDIDRLLMEGADHNGQ